MTWLGWLISGYAALIATLGLGWQIRSATKAHRTDLEVHLSLGRSWKVEEDQHYVTAHPRIVNRSQHQVTLEQVTLEGTEAPDAPMILGLAGFADRVISPHDGFSDGHLLERDGSMDWEEPVRARVLLRTGKWFESAAVRGAGPPPREVEGGNTGATSAPLGGVRAGMERPEKRRSRAKQPARPKPAEAPGSPGT